MRNKGKIGTSCQIVRIKDNRPLSKMNKLNKTSQKQRLLKEEELYEMMQLPNGDFKRVKK